MTEEIRADIEQWVSTVAGEISKQIHTRDSRLFSQYKHTDFEVFEYVGKGHCLECCFNNKTDFCIKGDTELVNHVFMQHPKSNPPGSCNGLIAKIKEQK